MKHSILIVLLTAGAISASAQTSTQTAAKPAADASPAATATASTQTTAKPAADAKPAATAPATPQTPAKPAADIKPLPHMPPAQGIHKILHRIDLTYLDVKVGTGAPAEPKKLLKYYYTLWLAADGIQLDSTDDSRPPVLDKDKKPVLDEKGEIKLGDATPATTIMGQGRPLPGWDMGFEGMKAGGKRRIFIPWELGIGERDIPARGPKHPAIPSKSDLVLDVELVDVTDAPPPPPRPDKAAHAHGAPGASPKLIAPEKLVAPPAPATTSPAAPAMTPPAATTTTPSAAPAKTPPAAPATTPPAATAPPATAQPQSK
jgi:peptidylprolyl isomerase